MDLINTLKITAAASSFCGCIISGLYGDMLLATIYGLISFGIWLSLLLDYGPNIIWSKK